MRLLSILLACSATVLVVSYWLNSSGSTTTHSSDRSINYLSPVPKRIVLPWDRHQPTKIPPGTIIHLVILDTLSSKKDVVRREEWGQVDSHGELGRMRAYTTRNGHPLSLYCSDDQRNRSVYWDIVGRRALMYRSGLRKSYWMERSLFALPGNGSMDLSDLHDSSFASLPSTPYDYIYEVTNTYLSITSTDTYWVDKASLRLVKTVSKKQQLIHTDTLQSYEMLPVGSLPTNFFYPPIPRGVRIMYPQLSFDGSAGT